MFLQRLEKAGEFWYGVRTGFSVLLCTPCFCKPRQGVQCFPVMDAPGRGMQVDAVVIMKSRFAKSHHFWGLAPLFASFSSESNLLWHVLVLISCMYFFQSQTPFWGRIYILSIQSEPPLAGFLLRTGKRGPRPQGLAGFSKCNLLNAAVEVLQLISLYLCLLYIIFCKFL